MKNFEPIPALKGTFMDVKDFIDSKNEHLMPPPRKAITSSQSEFRGFTLAETLITLMVIGVVAALTVPSLMTAYKDKQLATAKKKAQSILGNGYKKMMVEEETTFSDLPIFKCGEDFSCLSEVHRKIFNIGADKSKTNDGLPEKYAQSKKEEESDFKWEEVPYIFTTTDGMTYGYMPDEESGTIDVVVDVNGKQSPNKICQDIEKFKINGNGEIIGSKKDANGDFTGACTELDKKASKCSPTNLAECTDDAAIEALWESLEIKANSYGQVRSMNLTDESCFVMTNATHYTFYPRGGKRFGNSPYYYAFLTNKDGSDYSSYCN